MSRRSLLTSVVRSEVFISWLTTWMLTPLAAGLIVMLARLSWAWTIVIYLVLLAGMSWAWQLRRDIRDTYRHALMHADQGAAEDMPALEPRYVTLRFKRGLSPGIWAVVVYKGDNIRVYQGLGKIPMPPGRAEKSRFARQVG